MQQQTSVIGEITIRMDQTLSFTHTYRGAPGLLIPMLGALEFAKDWVKNEVKKDQPAPSALCKQAVPISIEKEVQRDEAIEFYWKAMEKMRDRILAINGSDPSSTFLVDPSFLRSL